MKKKFKQSSSTTIDIRSGSRMKSWQKTIIESSSFENREPDIIDVIYDPQNIKEKTFIKDNLDFTSECLLIESNTFFNDIFKTIISIKKYSVYVISIPENQNDKQKMDFIEAMKILKRGCVSDPRIPFRERFFDPPRIWLFFNDETMMKYFKEQNFRLWTINDNFEFCIYRDENK